MFVNVCIKIFSNLVVSWNKFLSWNKILFKSVKFFKFSCNSYPKINFYSQRQHSLPFYYTTYYSILYYTILYYTMLYILYYAMLCYAMLCYTILYYTIYYILYTIYTYICNYYQRQHKKCLFSKTWNRSLK